MVKKLFLLRHANSQKINQNGDFERILSAKGIRELEQLSSFLLHRNITVDIALCSPAIRTRQTWDYVQNKLAITSVLTFPEDLYNASTDDMLNIIHHIDGSYNNAVIIGHNPTISSMTNALIAGGGNLSFSPANMACLDFNITNWQDAALHTAKIEWFYARE